MDADKVIETQSVTNPTRSHSPRVLILGGTTEASELATQLATRDDLTVVSSFAGRVSRPRLPAGIDAPK
jgi:precorrin-6A/cobalt-precorrin-6A reductase